MIGRFYNGRDHSTVCCGIQRIEALLESDPEVDVLITDLRHELSASGDSPVEKSETKPHRSISLSPCDLQTLADLIANGCMRVLKSKSPLMKTDRLTVFEPALSVANRHNRIRLRGIFFAAIRIGNQPEPDKLKSTQTDPVFSRHCRLIFCNVAINACK